MANEIIRKLTSRKFWMAVAAFLGSIGGSITGMATGQEWLAVAGLVCSVLSVAIGAGCEAYVDGKREASTVTSTNISASTSSKDVVERIIGTETGDSNGSAVQ